jgi:transcriptional regulator with XRE-family HTH domain
VNTAIALRVIRVRFNLTQAEVGNKTGIKASSVTDLESGKVVASLSVISSYAKMLGVSTASLVTFIEGFDDKAYLLPPLAAEKRSNTKKTSNASPKVKAVKFR